VSIHLFRGVAHKQQLRQYDVEKAEESLTSKKKQRDDMAAQKVSLMSMVIYTTSPCILEMHGIIFTY